MLSLRSKRIWISQRGGAENAEGGEFEMINLSESPHGASCTGKSQGAALNVRNLMDLPTGE